MQSDTLHCQGRSCRRLRSFAPVVKNQHQKIAAFGNSPCVFQFRMFKRCFDFAERSHKVFRLSVGCRVSSLCSSLPIQRPGLETPMGISGAYTPFITYPCALRMCALRYGGCARGTFGSSGSPLPGFPTCVQLPPLRPETEGGSSDYSVELHLSSDYE